MSADQKESPVNKFIMAVLAGVIIWVAKDLYTRILDQIAQNSDRITDLRIIVESLKQ